MQPNFEMVTRLVMELCASFEYNYRKLTDLDCTAWAVMNLINIEESLGNLYVHTD